MSFNYPIELYYDGVEVGYVGLFQKGYISSKSFYY